MGRLGYKHTDEAKAKMSASRKGHITTELTRSKISSSHLGIKHSEETKAKMRVSRETRVCAFSECTNTFEVVCLSKKRFCCIGHAHKKLPQVRTCKNPNCNTTFTCSISSSKKYCSKRCASQCLPPTSDEVRRIRSSNGRKNWSKDSYRTKVITNATKSLNDPKVKLKRSLALKKYWNDELNREKQLKAIFKGTNRRPTKPEIELNNLLTKLFGYEYQYVGDGSFIVGYKNPDFVNVNGQKKIIEVFGCYWHGRNKTGVSRELHEERRKSIFRRYGYATLVVWEDELKDIPSISNKLLNFHKDKL